MVQASVERELATLMQQHEDSRHLDRAREREHHRIPPRDAGAERRPYEHQINTHEHPINTHEHHHIPPRDAGGVGFQMEGGNVQPIQREVGEGGGGWRGRSGLGGGGGRAKNLLSDRPFDLSAGPGDCCSVLQCVAVCCSVLQCVAVCCSVSHCVAVCCIVLQCVTMRCSLLLPTSLSLSVNEYLHHLQVQCVVMCCSVMQCVAVCCSVLQCVTVCCC